MTIFYLYRLLILVCWVRGHDMHTASHGWYHWCTRCGRGWQETPQGVICSWGKEKS